MKKIWMRKTDQKGFTLVELVVASGILILVLTMIYSFAMASTSFYDRTSKRADKQAQLRVVMLGIKEELKTAAVDSVKLLTDVEADNDDLILDSYFPGTGGYYMFFSAVDAADGNNKLWRLDEGGNRRTAYVDFQLPDLIIEFKVSADNTKLINVRLESDGVSVEGDLALLNAEARDLVGGDPDPAETYYGIILTQAVL